LLVIEHLTGKDTASYPKEVSFQRRKEARLAAQERILRGVAGEVKSNFPIGKINNAI
jgi:hypothetical protein